MKIETQNPATGGAARSQVDADLKTELMGWYYQCHKERFAYFVERVAEVLPVGSTVMDLGCHYLDQAVALSESGYRVHGFDAPVFAEMSRVKAIAARHNIALSTVDDLTLGQFGSDLPDSIFDALIFTETIEHLSFNPLLMWKTIFRLLKPNALLFVTTPNGLSLRRRVREIARIVLGKGRGVPVEEIFSGVTYGHHWKEYGIGELVAYFNYLGIPGDAIRIHPYRYWSTSEYWRRNKLKCALALLINLVPSFREDLLVIARMPEEKPSVPDPPRYS